MMERGNENLDSIHLWTKLLEREALHLFEIDWSDELTTACYALFTYGLVAHFVERAPLEESSCSKQNKAKPGSRKPVAQGSQSSRRLIFWSADLPVEWLVPSSIRRLSNESVLFTEDVKRADLEDSEHIVLVIASLSARLCRESELLSSILIPTLLSERVPPKLTVIAAVRPGELTFFFTEGLRAGATSCWKICTEGFFEGWVRVPLRNRCAYFAFHWELREQGRFRVYGRRCNPPQVDAENKSGYLSSFCSKEPAALVNGMRFHSRERDEEISHTMSLMARNRDSGASNETSTSLRASFESLSESLSFRISLSESEEHALARVKLPFEHYDERLADSIMKSPEGFVIYDNAEAEDPGSDPEVSSDEDLDV